MIKITITSDKNETKLKCTGGSTADYLGILRVAYDELKDRWIAVKFQGGLVLDEEE